MSRTFTRPRNFWSPGQSTAPVAHRSGITAADKLATPAAPTLAAVTEAGSNLAASAMNVSIAAGNRFGSTPGGATAALTPVANQALRTTIAKITNAEWYDIFIGTPANPLWVGRITEAQRAAGGFIISAVGTVTVGGGAAAGQVDLGIVGSGLANNVNPFLANTAATPAAVAAVGQLLCGDFEYADIFVELAVTDLRSLPTLVLTGFEQNGTDSNWSQFWTQSVSILTAVQQPLMQKYRVAVGGAQAIVICVDSIAGQGAAASVWIDLE